MKDATDNHDPLTPRARKFIVYIDGYNLYKAVASPEKLKYAWCNYKSLAHRLCQRSFGDVALSTDTRVEVKYFTAIVHQENEDTSLSKGEKHRQKLWLDTLKEATGIVPIRGQHLKLHEWRGSAFQEIRREKMTDVNIALAMVEDARTATLSGMVLVSGDLDFRPAVERVVGMGIPIVVYNPHDHPNYVMPPDTQSAGLFDMRYLDTDVMNACPLGYEDKWLQYLDLKVKFLPPGHRDYPAYADLLKKEQRQRKNRLRVASTAA